MNKAEYHILFKKMYTPLCNYANTILKDHDTSEDIVQGLFVDFWEKRENLSVAEDKIENYLVRATKLNCIDHLRKQNVHRKYETEIKHTQNDNTDDVDDSEINKEAIYLAIAQLPEKTKIVFINGKMNGLSYDEIAKKMDISKKTVENQMGRAFKHLRRILKDQKLFELFQIFFI